MKVSLRPVEPGVHLSEAWSAQLVMPTQPAPSECRHKYKVPIWIDFCSVTTALPNHERLVYDVEKCFDFCGVSSGFDPAATENLDSYGGYIIRIKIDLQVSR